MFKVKAWIFTPQILICYALLLVILAFVSNNNNQTHYDKDSDGIIRQYEKGEEPTIPNPLHTHPVTFKDLRDYQIEITLDGHYALMYDYDRLVGVLPLDNKCNLTNLIIMDND